MPAKPLHREPVPFITLPNWVKAAKQCGFNIEPVFRELGIETDLVNLESATIEQPLLERMMTICVGRSREQYFPFVLGETFAFDYLPDIETFLTTSATLRDALRVFDWVRELINPEIDVQLVERGAQALLVLWRDETAQRYFIETTFASILKFGRALLGPAEPFIELRLRYPPPPQAAAYTAHLGVTTHFDQDENALVFERSLLDRPLQGAFPALHEQAQRRVETRLQRLARRSGPVAAIEDLLEREPQLLGQGIAAVARRLGTGPRSLQRQLQKRGDGYAELLARVRYRLAMRWLREPGCDVEQAGERLGFSDRRSFTRAFKRWSGVTPSAFRSGG